MKAAARSDYDRVFFASMAMLAFAVILVGFAPTYYLKELFDAPPLKPLVHVHGALFTLWPVLLLVQVALVRVGRPDLHRALGQVGIIILILMVVTGFMVILGKPRPTVVMRAFIFLPMLDLLLMSLFVAVAIRYRRDAATHKRLMLLATIFIIHAGMRRALGLFALEGRFLSYSATYAMFLLPLVIYDLARLRRIHSATLAGVAAHILQHPLHNAVSHTDWWQAAAAWMTRS